MRPAERRAATSHGEGAGAGSTAERGLRRGRCGRRGSDRFSTADSAQRARRCQPRPRSRLPRCAALPQPLLPATAGPTSPGSGRCRPASSGLDSRVPRSPRYLRLRSPLPSAPAPLLPDPAPPLPAATIGELRALSPPRVLSPLPSRPPSPAPLSPLSAPSALLPAPRSCPYSPLPPALLPGPPAPRPAPPATCAGGRGRRQARLRCRLGCPLPPALARSRRSAERWTWQACCWRCSSCWCWLSLCSPTSWCCYASSTVRRSASRSPGFSW